ncbi:phage holin family protein [Carnobacterium maltaromaticum]|uniref:phage holin family protein n=1 Tax=Carnobacterium maltaromaticum TaxID=2751 RepID=UPI00295E7109|nr:phage holin family protein [Carnobacterium maltaromaticum]
MDNFLRGVSTVLGAMVGLVFGNWDALLGVLMSFVIADYITGLLAGGSTVGLSSKVGFKGIAKKVVIFVIVGVAHGIDILLGDKNMFRDATIFFYLANEVISILENAAKMEVLVPIKLQEAIKQFLKLSGEKEKMEDDK